MNQMSQILQSTNLHIRLIEEDDIESVLGIYRPYIEETAITFETEVPTLEEFKKRVHRILESYPFLVYEQNGEILGYAYANRYRERKAYDYVVESSVYLIKEVQGQGIGKQLYLALIDVLKKQGFQDIMACFTIPNESSVRLHEKLGFQYVGTQEKMGYKLGAWHSVGWMQLMIGQHEDEPSKITWFCEFLNMMK